jgi:hypothetical protein
MEDGRDTSSRHARRHPRALLRPRRPRSPSRPHSRSLASSPARDTIPLRPSHALPCCCCARLARRPRLASRLISSSTSTGTWPTPAPTCTRPFTPPTRTRTWTTARPPCASAWPCTTTPPRRPHPSRARAAPPSCDIPRARRVRQPGRHRHEHGRRRPARRDRRISRSPVVAERPAAEVAVVWWRALDEGELDDLNTRTGSGIRAA